MLQGGRSFPLYDPKLVERARWLRKNSTLGEVLLWERLKGRQLLGYKFIRQIPIWFYIVDFYCRELRLIIEIDGFSHDFKLEYDKEREHELQAMGYAILRFQERQIRHELDNVIQVIVDWINGHATV